MALEKAFAISATPREIYAALERDLQSAGEYEGTTHQVLSRVPDRLLELQVTIGVVPCRLTYRITPRAGGDTEVSALLEPYGWRYAMFQIVTLGMRRTFFEFALVDALSNLKAAVESREP